MLRHFFLVEKSEVCNYPWKGVCRLSEERKAHISVLANWYFSAVCLFLLKLRLQLASNFLLLCIVWLFHSALWLCYWISFKIKCKSGKNEFLSFMKILHTNNLLIYTNHFLSPCAFNLFSFIGEERKISSIFYWRSVLGSYSHNNKEKSIQWVCSGDSE